MSILNQRVPIYIILIRPRNSDDPWETTGCVFSTRSAAENNMKLGRSLFYYYRVVEIFLEVPRD